MNIKRIMDGKTANLDDIILAIGRDKIARATELGGKKVLDINVDEDDPSALIWLEQEDPSTSPDDDEDENGDTLSDRNCFAAQALCRELEKKFPAFEFEEEENALGGSYGINVFGVKEGKEKFD